MTQFGYAGTILKIDLSDRKILNLQTSDYSEKYLGGRGIAAKIYWDMVLPETQASDAENCLIITSGPVAGFTRLAGCRWQVCAKTPTTESFTYANLGGKWGSWLKYAGYDGIVIQGKADKPVYIFIKSGEVEIRDASIFWGKSVFQTCDLLKAQLGEEIKVLTIGQSGENLVSFANILTDDGSSGSGGLGSVMGSKLLKAIVVTGNLRPIAAKPDEISRIADRLYPMRKGNFENVPMLQASFSLIKSGRTKLDACYGCIAGCYKQSYQAENGRRFKLQCQAGNVYRKWAANFGEDSNEVAWKATRLCDDYGLNTCVMEPMIEWLSQCFKEGLLTDDMTGIPISRIGSVEFIEILTKKIASREGFGNILADGTLKAAASVGKRALELAEQVVLTRTNEYRDYDPRLILTNAILLATEPRLPIQQIHEAGVVLAEWVFHQCGIKDSFLSSDVLRDIAVKFWGSEEAADYSSYGGKALAAKKIQDRSCVKESMVLCDCLWPMSAIKYSEDHAGDPTLESQVYSAVTGKETDEAELNQIGERIFNLQRAILIRQGWGGRQGDLLLDYLFKNPLLSGGFDPQCIVPGKNGEAISRKGAVIEKDRFEKLKDEYYELRGWEVASGLQTKIKLKELQLHEVAADLEKRGLLKT